MFVVGLPGSEAARLRGSKHESKATPKAGRLQAKGKWSVLSKAVRAARAVAVGLRYDPPLEEVSGGGDGGEGGGGCRFRLGSTGLESQSSRTEPQSAPRVGAGAELRGTVKGVAGQALPRGRCFDIAGGARATWMSLHLPLTQRWRCSEWREGCMAGLRVTRLPTDEPLRLGPGCGLARDEVVAHPRGLDTLGELRQHLRAETRVKGP